jgi:hypothetical protein
LLRPAIAAGKLPHARNDDIEREFFPVELTLKTALRLHKPPEYQQYNCQGGKAGYGVNPEGQGFGTGFLRGFRGGSGGGSVAAGRATVLEEGFFAGEVAFWATDRLKHPAAARAVFRV